MSVDEKFTLDSIPHPTQSNASFHQEFLNFQKARTLRDQHITMGRMVFSAIDVTIRGESFASFIRQPLERPRRGYAPLLETIGLRHVMGKRSGIQDQPPKPTDIDPGKLPSRAEQLDTAWSLKALFMPTSTGVLSICYHNNLATDELDRVIVANPSASLLATTNQLERPFDDRTEDPGDDFTKVAQTALLYRRHVIQTILDRAIAVNGSIVIEG